MYCILLPQSSPSLYHPNDEVYVATSKINEHVSVYTSVFSSVCE